MMLIQMFLLRFRNKLCFFYVTWLNHHLLLVKSWFVGQYPKSSPTTNVYRQAFQISVFQDLPQ